MSTKTLSRWQKIAVLGPLAIASGAWTATIAAPSGDSDSVRATSSEASSTEGSGILPDGTTVPTQAIEAPASVSSPGTFGSGGYDGSLAQRIKDASSVNGIPSAGLAAYQRASQVINAADKQCNLGWQLTAAIGRVESDHGRFGGNVLTADGVSRPGIYGVPLDGSKGTARISDTDSGKFDNDKVWDRAMGPMQFIPSTWGIVGVDSDGDGDRNPQDIDDAALATGVYLCSGSENLSNEGDQRKAIFRYNRSEEYVDLVLAIMKAYEEGNFTTTPNSLFAGTTFFPSPQESVVTNKTKGAPKKANKVPTPKPDPVTSGGGVFTGGSSDSGGIIGGGSSGSSGGGAVGGTVDDATGTVGGAVDNTRDTVENTLTPLQKAQNYCSSRSLGGASVSQCISAYQSGGAAAVENLIAGLSKTTKDATDGVKDTVGGVTGGLGG